MPIAGLAAPTREGIIDGIFSPVPALHRADDYIGEMKHLYRDDPGLIATIDNRHEKIDWRHVRAGGRQPETQVCACLE